MYLAHSMPAAPIAHAGGLGFIQAAVAAPLAAAGPVGWAVLGITAALPFLPRLFKIGNDPKKEASSQAVDAAEPQLRANLEQYLAGPRTAAAQQTAIARFDQIWASVVNYCSDPQLGAAGAACIADRERSGRWPWAVYYRDPIAADAPTDAGSWAAVMSNPDVLVSSPDSYVWLLGAGLVAAGVLL